MRLFRPRGQVLMQYKKVIAELASLEGVLLGYFFQVTAVTSAYSVIAGRQTGFPKDCLCIILPGRYSLRRYESGSGAGRLISIGLA